MNKVFPDAQAALHDVADGAVILAGGFGLSGNPENCIRELARKQVKDLTVVSNNCGTTDKGCRTTAVRPTRASASCSRRARSSG
jgi:3-oxoacid CoA-transferase subunit A